MKKILVNILTKYEILTKIAVPLFFISALSFTVPLTGLMFDYQAELSYSDWFMVIVFFVFGITYTYFVMEYSPFQKAIEAEGERKFIKGIAEKRGVSLEEAEKIYDQLYPPVN